MTEKVEGMGVGGGCAAVRPGLVSGQWMLLWLQLFFKLL